MTHVASRPLTIEQVLAVLHETPSRIATLAAGLTPAQVRTSPAEDEWAVNDVLAHLRACADVWGDSMVAITSQDTPTIRAVNPRTWMKETNYPEQEFKPSLRAFTRQRTDLMAVLEPLPREGWARTATVTGAGKPLELSVLSYGQRFARHERAHVNQIGRIVKAVQS
jgi:hypothetical protein